jgi:hypothetical protein
VRVSERVAVDDLVTDRLGVLGGVAAGLLVREPVPDAVRVDDGVNDAVGEFDGVLDGVGVFDGVLEGVGELDGVPLGVSVGVPLPVRVTELDGDLEGVGDHEGVTDAVGDRDGVLDAVRDADAVPEGVRVELAVLDAVGDGDGTVMRTSRMLKSPVVDAVAMTRTATAYPVAFSPVIAPGSTKGHVSSPLPASTLAPGGPATSSYAMESAARTGSAENASENDVPAAAMATAPAGATNTGSSADMRRSTASLTQCFVWSPTPTSPDAHTS